MTFSNNQNMQMRKVLARQQARTDFDEGNPSCIIRSEGGLPECSEVQGAYYDEYHFLLCVSSNDTAAFLNSRGINTNFKLGN